MYDESATFSPTLLVEWRGRTIYKVRCSILICNCVDERKGRIQMHVGLPCQVGRGVMGTADRSSLV
jgi:hypothetical protein